MQSTLDKKTKKALIQKLVQLKKELQDIENYKRRETQAKKRRHIKRQIELIKNGYCIA
jgi:cell fate (sporulation/competence/biofilm development) regulator YmcA (YheA/YmcA/DUF963 family)